MSLITDQISSGIIVVDQHLTVRVWNRWMAEQAAIPAEDAIGHKLSQLFPSLPSATLSRRVKAALQLRSPSYLQPREGYLFPVQLERIVDSHFDRMQQRIRILPYDGKDEQAVIVVDDVTATREAEAQAAAAAEVSARYLALIDRSVMTFSVDADDRITHASDALLHRLGKTARDLVGLPAQEAGLGELGQIEGTEAEPIERCLQRSDGGLVWVRARRARELSDDQDQDWHVVLEDITLEKEIQAFAERDILTGAYNRLKFDQLLAEALAAHRRYDQVFSLILCDIDHFKRINDRFGHLAGDEVLKQFAALLKQKTRATDQLARWGGEEFVLLLPMTTEPQAAAAAEILRQAIAELDWPIIGRLSASFGVGGHLVSEPTEALFDRVDSALYRAKEGGRNRVCVAGTNTSTVASDRP